jgi:hypothetical protein
MESAAVGRLLDGPGLPRPLHGITDIVRGFMVRKLGQIV